MTFDIDLNPAASGRYTSFHVSDVKCLRLSRFVNVIDVVNGLHFFILR